MSKLFASSKSPAAATVPVAAVVVLLAALAPGLPPAAHAMVAGDVLGWRFAGYRSASFVEGAEGGAFSDPDYQAGQMALDAGRYAAAAESFAKLAARGGDDADAALYWLAYAQSKAGQKAEALAALEKLRTRHGRSAWLDDARALEMELRGPRHGEDDETSEDSESHEDHDADDDADNDDEEMKLYALNALMNTDSERAVSTLERFLAGNHSRRLLEQALFVLSQSDSPRARQVLADVARGQRRPELRRKAIETLGIAGDEASVRLLSEIYAGVDREAKKAVLDAFLISGEQARVLAAAKTERDPELREKAIGVLGAMGAVEELREFYRTETSTDIKRKLLDAMFVAGDVQTLSRVAKTDPDPEMRRKAIQGLGVSDEEQSGPVLVEIYAAAGDDAQTKRAVIEGLFIQGNAKALLAIAKTEKDRGLRREALQRLSLMDEPEALDFLLEKLEE